MKISIIVPVYNAEKYIALCLDSILNQTFQDFEIVVVNDCTPDKSIKIVQKYAKTDSRIKILEYEENAGPMWARMIGYTNAKGEYLVFCDSDDTMPLNALELLYNKIIETRADIVIGNYEFHTLWGRIVSHKNKLEYGSDSLAVYESLLKGECAHSLWGKIYSRNLFKNYKYDCFKNFTNSEDAILFYELVNNCEKVTLMQDNVYNYFQRIGSSTQKRLSKNALMNIEVALNLQYELIKENKLLLSSFNKKKIDSLYSRARQKYKLSLIQSYSTIPNSSSYFKFKTINKYHNIFKSIFIYILFKIRY